MIQNITSAAKLTREHMGNKAYVLNKLSREGFRICSGYVLSSRFFEKFCRFNHIYPDTPAIANQIRDGRFDDDSRTLLRGVFQTVIKKTGQIIVRSSGTDEDADGKSFAGIYESVSYITTYEQMLQGIKKVWCSFFAGRATMYSDVLAALSIPVMIQEMLACDKSGVLFSRNPVSGQDQILIEACSGNNAGITHGEKKAVKNILTKKERTALRRLCVDIECRLGYPCDVEWGIQNHEIYIFQARPISVCRDNNIYTAPSASSGDCILLDRYANPASVCYLSLLDAWQNQVYLSYYTKRPGASFDEKPLCFRSNRVYWNTKYQKKYFEDNGKHALWRRIKLHYLIQTGYKRWYSRLPQYHESLNLLRREMEALSNPTQIPALLDRIIDNFCVFLGADHFLFLGIAQMLYKKADTVLKEEKYDASKIIGENPNKNKTVQANEDLLAIVANVQSHPALRTLFLQSSEQKILQFLSEEEEYRDCKTLLSAFLTKHGHRGIDCDDLYYPHWSEAPGQVILLIKQLLQLPAPASTEKEKPIIENKKTRRLVTLTNEYMCLRENQRYYFDKSWVLLRSLLLKTANHFIERGILSDAQDIFHMTIGEIQDALKYKNYAPPSSTIHARRQNYLLQRQQIPPYMIKDCETVAVQKNTRSKSYKAMGISSGTACGKIRIVHSLNDLGHIEKGEIGAVKTFHPSWTPILKIVSGLIMNYGNMLSHGAVIAREYKIPVVVFNGDAASFFQNGDVVEINGTKGRIKVLEKMV